MRKSCRIAALFSAAFLVADVFVPADAAALRTTFVAPDLASTSVKFERAIRGRRFATQKRPLVGAASRSHPTRVALAKSDTAFVVNVPLGGDVAQAASEVDYAGGGIVQLAAGTYHLTSSIPLLSNITIQGQGSSTIIQSPQTPHGFAMMANVSEGIGNIVIKNLVLDGNIPLGSFGTGVYGGAGIYLVALNNAIQPVTISNVEIKNTSIGLLLDGVNQITVNNSYIHDNNPGGFSHNAYFIACTAVNISHSRFDHALTGDGLHFDFGSSLYTISKSEFSNNNGLGILDQGGQQETVSDTVANGNQNDGFNMSSQSSFYTRDLASNDWGFGYNNGGGSGVAYYLAGFNDGGSFGQFFGYGFGGLLLSNTANVYPAIMAQGDLGPIDTADWSTTYPGTSTIGEVDFNTNHLANGLLTFNVGSVGGGNTPVTVRYSNGTTNTLKMRVNVNGAFVGTMLFPPTGSYSTWSTTQMTLPFVDGNNTVAVRPNAAGAPELDYLQSDVAVPAVPGAPTVSVSPRGPYANYLSWKKVPGAQYYTVYRAGAPVSIGNNITATNYTDASLLTGASTNTYVVSASNQGGSGPGSAGVSVTSPLDAPTGFTVSVTSSGNALSWISTAGATSYIVKRSTNSSGPYQGIATVPSSVTSYTDASAVSGGSYYYAIAATNGSKQSKNSYQQGVNAPAAGELSQDIGNVGASGLTTYDPTAGTIGVSGAGAGVYNAADAFHYEYLPVTGDVTMTAHLDSEQAIEPATQVGIDVRQSLDPGSPDALVGISPYFGAESLSRVTAGAQTSIAGIVSGIGPGYWLQMTRSGNTFTSSISPDDVNWTDIGQVTIPMTSNIYIGLASSSTTTTATGTGVFDAVTTVGTLTPQAKAALRHVAAGRMPVLLRSVRAPR